MEREELLFEIAKQLNLSYRDYEMLIEDINNLRGDEWIETVSELQDKNIIKKFKEEIYYG